MLPYLVHRAVSFGNDTVFGLGHDNVVHAPRDAAARGILKTQFFDVIQKFDRARLGHGLDYLAGELNQLFAGHDFVDVGRFVGQNFVEQKTAYRGCRKFAARFAETDFYLGP